MDLKHDLRVDKPAELQPDRTAVSMYRPFCKHWLHSDHHWNERVYLIPSLFPTPEHANDVIAITVTDNRSGFSTFISHVIPNLNVFDKTQCFPRYRYAEAANLGHFVRRGQHRRLYPPRRCLLAHPRLPPCPLRRRGERR